MSKLVLEKIEQELPDGEIVHGRIVFTTRDLDERGDLEYAYPTPQALIDYANDLFESGGGKENPCHTEPKTLKLAVEYLRGYNIEVKVGFEGYVKDKGGNMII